MSWGLCGVASFIAHAIGDYETARSEAQRCLGEARRIGAPSMLAGALHLFAHTVSDDNPDEAWP